MADTEAEVTEDKIRPISVRPPGAKGGFSGSTPIFAGLRKALGVEIVDCDRDVVVAVTEVVGLVAAHVDRPLQGVGIPRKAHIDVVGGLELQLPRRSYPSAS